MYVCYVPSTPDCYADVMKSQTISSNFTSNGVMSGPKTEEMIKDTSEDAVLDPSGASLGTKQRPQKVQREDTDSLTDIDLHSLFSSLSDFSKNLKGKWSEIAFLHQGLKLRNPELPQGRSKWFNNGRMSRRLSSSVRT